MILRPVGMAPVPGGGACRTGILRAQIEATAEQFDGVNQVRFIDEELFQP